MSKIKEDQCHHCKLGETCPFPVSCTPKGGGAWSWGSDTPKSATSATKIEPEMSRSALPVLKPKFAWKDGDKFTMTGGPVTNIIFEVTEVGVRGVYSKNAWVKNLHFSWNELQELARKIS